MNIWKTQLCKDIFLEIKTLVPPTIALVFHDMEHEMECENNFIRIFDKHLFVFEVVYFCLLLFTFV